MLGEGGCGRVLTLDELDFRDGAAYDVLVLDQGDAGIRVAGRAGNLRDLARILGMNAVELFHSVVYKTGLHRLDGSDEVIRTSEMLRAIARLNNRAALATVSRTLPILQIGKSSFAIGLRDARNHDVIMPMYARMQGSLFDLRGVIDGPDVLEAVRAVLDAIAVLRESGSHHRDIKDENILWKMGKGGGVQYVLSDFGHIKINPTQTALASMRGTEGFMSPLMYGHDESAKRMYQSHMLKNVVLATDAIWNSYSPRPGPLSPSQQLEKNDLYAVGIILFETFNGPDKGGYKDFERVRAFAHALVDGSKRNGIWTIAKARKWLNDILTTQKSQNFGSNKTKKPLASQNPRH